MFKLVWFSFLLILVYAQSIECISVKLTPDGKMKPVPGYVFLGDCVDLSNIEFMPIEDDKSIITGNATIKCKFDPTKTIKLTAVLMDNVRGLWQDTSYYVEVLDVCNRLFLDNQPWSNYTKKFEKDERICPPKIGTVYKMRNSIANFRVDNVPFLPRYGEYRIKIILSEMSPETNTNKLTKATSMPIQYVAYNTIYITEIEAKN